MRKLTVSIIGMAALAACSYTAPVAAIDEGGHVMRGQATASFDGGRYTLSDGRTTCAGNYNAFDTSQTIPLSILCDDGRTGIGSATRTVDGTGGSGQFSMSDGSQWRFVFGHSAAALL